MKEVVTAGFWAKSGSLSLWPMLCCQRISDEQTVAGRKPSPMHGRAWEPGVTEDFAVSLRRMSPVLGPEEPCHQVRDPVAMGG